DPGADPFAAEEGLVPHPDPRDVGDGVERPRWQDPRRRPELAEPRPGLRRGGGGRSRWRFHARPSYAGEQQEGGPHRGPGAGELRAACQTFSTWTSSAY